MVMVAMMGILVSGFEGVTVGASRPPPYRTRITLLEPFESAQEGGELVARGLVGRDVSALAAVDMDEGVARRAGAVADCDGRVDLHSLQDARGSRGAVVAAAHAGHGLR